MNPGVVKCQILVTSPDFTLIKPLKSTAPYLEPSASPSWDSRDRQDLGRQRLNLSNSGVAQTGSIFTALLSSSPANVKKKKKN